MDVTIDLNTIPGESSLVDQGLKEQLAGIFGRMEKRVTIRAVVDLSGEKDREMASFLRAIVSVSPNLELELYGPDEADQVLELNTAWLPVTGLYKDGAYGRAAFHGVPGGREINSFVLAVYNLAGPGQEVPKGTRKKIERLDKRTNIKICVSLACHHCPLVVTACQQIAFLNPNIEAEMIDAALYDDLVAKYDIKRVPMMIINDSRIVMGSKTIDEIVTLLK
ncbi:thioredoxin family protein [Enterocloster clostridioformis]|uniref:thioredoxin family protein n=1 Tax=Enterocloster clostridioformis TaxID=1531 RepID=UPI000412E3AC